MQIDKTELARLVAHSICGEQDFTEEVRENVLRELSRRQDAAIRKAIDECLTDIAAATAEHLRTAKFQRTNQWGEPQGGNPISLAEWVEGEMKRQAGDLYSNKNLLSAMQKVAGKAVEEEVKRMLSEQRDAIKAGIADLVAKRIVEHTAR